MRVSWSQVLAWRLRRQLLCEPSVDLVEAARQVGGVQAQVASCAELALGIRTGAKPSEVRAALWDDRQLVKTWAMRGTLHLLPADELPTWVGAMKVKNQLTRRGAAWERYHGITLRQVQQMTDAISQVLGAEPLTREELCTAVIDKTGDESLRKALTIGWGAGLKPAAASGELCFGPDRLRNVTFVNPKRWLGGKWREPNTEDAMSAILARFFDAYGPADAADFALWFGVPPSEGKRLIRTYAQDLVEVDLEGSKHWLTSRGAEEVAASQPVSGHVRLVAGFDAYVFSPKSHRQHTWPAGHHGRISRIAGWITPCLLVDGLIGGVWGYTRGSARVSVEIEPLTRLTRAHRSKAERQARDLEPLFGTPVEVKWVTQLSKSAGSVTSDTSNI
jgi:hypothetical protein